MFSVHDSAFQMHGMRLAFFRLCKIPVNRNRGRLDSRGKGMGLLQFNNEKFKVMHLGRKNPEHQYHMGNTPVSTTEEEKDLGLGVNPNLKPSVEVARQTSSNSMVGMLTKSYTCQDTEMFLPLYIPDLTRLKYSNQAWCPYTQRQTN